ncbi:MAG: hypothetical protein FJ026_15010, partial [Chloroflexi bacterium]|nr:hypothetical protein [Chloroflexota bacterium]
FLSVTFDQPMVPLTAHADLAAKDVPVKLSPLPEGSWRWVGTKTLMYQPVGRFPKATRYIVEIPQGTTSATGGQLAQAITWMFTLPPPHMVSSYPMDGPQVRDPLLFVVFDQRIDPAAVLRTIQLKAAGRVFALRLAQPEEVEADEAVKRLAKEAEEGYWLAFRATELLPYDSTVTVDIGPGTPSAEGPLTTQQVQSFQFVTYGPLRVVEAKCGWDNRCPPLTPWHIRFSNPLDEDAFDESMVQVSPTLSGGKLSIFGDTLQIEGRSEGRTTYKITLKASIKDRFGQTLGRDETVSIEVGSAEPMMYTPWQNLVVIDPASKPGYSVFTTNYSALKVRAYAVQAEDWPDYLEFLKDASRREAHRDPPGRKVLDQSLPIESVMDRLVETPIDLTSFLNNGRGHVILVITPDQPQAGAPPDWKPEIRVWVQATRLGLAAFVDGQGMLAWANSLLDGAPLEGVSITAFPGQATGKTNHTGLAQLRPADQSQGQPAYLVARLGEDTALLPESSSWWSYGWRTENPMEEYRWYVFDDRQMYRPGEQVHIKGWIRLVKWSEGADVFTRLGQGSTVSYQLMDSRGNELLKGTLPVNALGGFDTSFTLPETMNLGYANLRLTLSASGSGREHMHAFQVQEFRRPEFEVSTSVSEGPHFVGGYATATVEAKYYAGGPLANAEVMWNVVSRPGTFRPPNWDDFDFGIWVPWWRFEYSRGFPGVEHTRAETYSGRTDAAGTHSLRIDF